MAWPKLRTPKSPDQLETKSNHSGAAPDGARPHGPASDRAEGSRAGGDAAVNESPADAPEAAPDTGDVPFWDWAGANDPVELDDPGDAFPRDDRLPAGAASTDPPRLVITPVEVADDQRRPAGIGQRRG